MPSDRFYRPTARPVFPAAPQPGWPDNEYFRRAMDELAPERTFLELTPAKQSQVLARAQQIKDEARAAREGGAA